jgi:serine/threonine protein kinase
MELCDDTLLNYIECVKKRPLSTEEIFKTFSQLNNSLKIMSENKIVHRDIKLENILVKYTNKEKTEFIPKMADFGTCKEIKEYGPNTYIGSPQIMAPQVFRNEKYGPKADLWSMGVIIYYSHFMEYPFDLKKLNKGIIKLENKRPKDFYLADLLDKLLVENEDERIGWEDYFNHPFFKIKGLQDFNIGFKSDHLKYKKALYKNDDGKYINVLIKEIRLKYTDKNVSENEFSNFYKLKDNENVLKIIDYQELKLNNEEKLIYLIFECDEKCVSLCEYYKTHTFEEEEIVQINNHFFEIFKTNADTISFISIYSFVVNPNGKLKLIDFGLNRQYLQEEIVKKYYAPNEKEFYSSELPKITLLMNYGITLLMLIYNDNFMSFFDKNNNKKPKSKNINDFLEKCLCRILLKRPKWEDLENHEIFGEKNMLLNKEQLKSLLKNLLKKYNTIIKYYNDLSIDNLEFMTENEDFLLFTIFEINMVRKILCSAKEFNDDKKNRITLLTITVNEEKGDGDEPQYEAVPKFVNLNSNNCFKMKLTNFKAHRKLIDECMLNISRDYDELKKIILQIKKKTNSDKFSLTNDNVSQNFLENFVKNFEKTEFHKFFLSFFANFSKKYYSGEDIDYNKIKTELKVCKYIAEFLLFFKQSINEADIFFWKEKYRNKEKLINDINEVFIQKKEQQKYVLISFLLCEDLKKVMDEKLDEDSILMKDNKNAFNELIHFYAEIMRTLKFVKSKINKKFI